MIDPFTAKKELVDPFAKKELIDPFAEPPNPEDTQELTTLGMLGQTAKSFNESILSLPDLLLPGKPLQDSLQWLQEQASGDTREDFVPAGSARTTADMSGLALSLGVGFTPVLRSTGKVSSVFQDLMGVGMSTADDAAILADRSAAALAKTDALRLGPEKLDTPEALYDKVTEVATRKFRELKTPKLDEYEKSLYKATKGLTEKGDKKMVRKLLDDGSVAEAQRILREKGVLDEAALPTLRASKDELKQVVTDAGREITETYGKTREEIGAVLKENKGVKFTDPVATLFQKTSKFSDASGVDRPISRWEYWTQPVVDDLRRTVDKRVGGLFEKAAETATRWESTISDVLIKPHDKVIKLLSEDRAVKRLLMDAHLNPENLYLARNVIRDKLGTEGVQSFDEFLNKSQGMNARVNGTLFKKDPKIKDDIFFHTERSNKPRGKGTVSSLPRIGKSDTTTPSGLKARTRKPAWKMTDAEVDEYMNPLLSQAKYLSEMEHLVQIAKEFGVRPSIKTGNSVDDFFAGMEKQLIRDGMDAERAKTARELMNHHYMGMKNSPTPAIRAFMSLAYAGTLAQLKTASLNLTDVFVSMVNNGVTPTMKALVQSTKGQFGKTLQQLGLGDAQNTGEFVRDFDKYITNPTTAQRIARMSHGTADFYMKTALYKFADGIGKGVVLRAALNSARSSAKNGTLYKNFGDVLSKEQLTRIRPWLAKGANVGEMPDEVGKIVEQLAFTALGKQQLISAAGRPLGYLDNPTLRPAYAMTGFAIKQLAMLKRGIGDALREGRGAEAAAYAAKYTMFAALGTSLFNEGRKSVFTNKEFAPEDVLVGVLEHIASVVTLNRLGDPYSLQKFNGNPVEMLMQTLLPPLGLNEALVSDAYDLIIKGEYNANLVKTAPLLGDFYKYYWAEDKPKDKGSNLEQYKKMFKED